MDDARFYFLSASGLAIAAGLSASLMKASHVEDSQISMVVGFAGVMLTNAVIAYRGAVKAEEVKVALVASTAEVAVKADQVRGALEQAESERAAAVRQATAHANQMQRNLMANSSQIEEIRAATQENRATGEAIHKLVNGQYGLALQTVADTAAELYALTGTADHKAALDRAVAALEEHIARCAAGLPDAPAPPP